MFFIRIFIILISTVFILTTETTFSASGSNITGSGIAPSRTKEIEKDDEIEEEKIENKQTEKNAQKIILEVYKIQGNKILKDMDISIEKVNSDPKIRVEIYSSIQKTLEFRRQKVEKSEMSNESKDILIRYIEYMISSIEKKKKNLE